MHIPPASSPTPYRGRLAPSPTGYLHRGHARTFAIAAQRARDAGGTLLLRIDDLDRQRCRPEFTAAAIDDLRWLGLHWDGPPVLQSQRLALYRRALETLHATGLIYPCTRTRKEIRDAANAAAAAAARRTPNETALHKSSLDREEPEQDAEPLYPIAFRPVYANTAATTAAAPRAINAPSFLPPLPPLGEPITTNWRLRTPDGETLRFHDRALGPQTAHIGTDIGDFLVWRKDDLPSYQLACTVDDIAMGITEVVRGADLLRSTFRQLLLYRALATAPPAFYHCELVRDETGHRLAKRTAATRLRPR